MKQPKLWFVQLESEFLLYRIRSDDVKYNSVIRHLDQQALATVADIVENPPASEKYTRLKEALISRFSDSEEKRIRQLLAGLELNDKKSSDLLHETRQLANGAIADNVLLTIWLQHLPQCVQATLAVVEDCPLVKLAELADKIINRDSGYQVATDSHHVKSSSSNFMDLERRIAALEVKRLRSRSRTKFRAKTRSRSKSKNKFGKADKTICFYHERFGDKARKCTIPCSMTNSLNKQTEN